MEKEKYLLLNQPLNNLDDRRDRERMAEIKQELCGLGLFRRGTLQKRYGRCPRLRCRCRADPPKLHGPIYHWTRKVKGTTVSVYLTAEQAELMGEWIANARRLDELIEELQEVSFRITERQLPPKPARRGGKRGVGAPLG
jgi:hypothetical protein